MQKRIENLHTILLNLISYYHGVGVTTQNKQPCFNRKLWNTPTGAVKLRVLALLRTAKTNIWIIRYPSNRSTIGWLKELTLDTSSVNFLSKKDHRFSCAQSVLSVLCVVRPRPTCNRNHNPYFKEHYATVLP